jgi:hypothetical protein
MASDMKFRVRDIEINVDVAGDIVDGRCLNTSTGGRLEVIRDGRGVGYAHFGTEDDGSFSIFMGEGETLGYDPANIHGGDKIRVTCLLAKGDALVKSIIVP